MWTVNQCASENFLSQIENHIKKKKIMMMIKKNLNKYYESIYCKNIPLPRTSDETIYPGRNCGGGLSFFLNCFISCLVLIFVSLISAVNLYYMKLLCCNDFLLFPLKLPINIVIYC